MSLGQSFGKKSAESKPRAKEEKSSRVRLTWTNGAPTLHEVRLLAAEAEKNRGIPCELPIRVPMGVFLLSCQSDHLSSEPCWTLYEGEDGSKQVWSYMQENVDMMFDMVNMSVTSKDSKTVVKLPSGENMPAPAQPPAPAPDAAQPAANHPAAPNPFVGAPTATHQSIPVQPPSPQAPIQGGWQAPTPIAPWGGLGNAASPDPAAGAGWNANPVAQPGAAGWPSPGQSPDNIWATTPAAAPPQAAPPAAWPSDAQPAQDPWNNQANASPWTNSAQAPAPAPAYAPAPAPAAPSDSPWRSDASAARPHMDLSVFAASLNQKKDVPIGELAMDPSVPQACVDAALKLQEMVLKGHFSDKVAVVALRFAAMNNGVLDDTVITRAKLECSPISNDAARQAAALLKQSGLLTDEDINTAEGTIEKHDNSFAAALISSGKIDKLVLESAQECQPLIADGRMRPDQAIIALHYCHRSRATLKDAIEDLSIQLS
jgi:hypothetical protein